MSIGELVRQLKRRAHKEGIRFEVKKYESKGSHRTVYFGDRRTTVPWTSDLATGMLHRILKQLGIDDF